MQPSALSTVAESPRPQAQPPTSQQLSKAHSASAGELSDRSIELQSKPVPGSLLRSVALCVAGMRGLSLKLPNTAQNQAAERKRNLQASVALASLHCFWDSKDMYHPVILQLCEWRHAGIRSRVQAFPLRTCRRDGRPAWAATGWTRSHCRTRPCTRGAGARP